MRWYGWASDSFARGGTLVDTDRWYAGRDKVQHVIVFAALWLVLAPLPIPEPLKLAIWETVSCGFEVWEWYRFDRWVQRFGAITPWPAFADRPSWRDLIANHAGLVLAQLYVVLIK